MTNASFISLLDTLLGAAAVTTAECSLLGWTYREIDFCADECSDALRLVVELFSLSGCKSDCGRHNNVEPFGTLAALPDAGGYAVDQE